MLHRVSRPLQNINMKLNRRTNSWQLVLFVGVGLPILAFPFALFLWQIRVRRQLSVGEKTVFLSALAVIEVWHVSPLARFHSLPSETLPPRMLVLGCSHHIQTAARRCCRLLCRHHPVPSSPASLMPTVTGFEVSIQRILLAMLFVSFVAAQIHFHPFKYVGYVVAGPFT